MNKVLHETVNTRKTNSQIISSEIFNRLINVAGRQRMLSQRIILNIFISMHGQASALKIARDDLQLFNDSHHLLVYGDQTMPGVFFDALKEAYFGPEDGHQKIMTFINLANQTLSAFEREYRTSETLIQELSVLAMPMVTLLNKVTMVYEAESQQFAKAEQKKRLNLMSDIQNIAKQAKIIAVNAQIAAARAGDVGREFSVVAMELTKITEKIDTLVNAALSDPN